MERHEGEEGNARHWKSGKNAIHHKQFLLVVEQSEKCKIPARADDQSSLIADWPRSRSTTAAIVLPAFRISSAVFRQLTVNPNAAVADVRRAPHSQQRRGGFGRPARTRAAQRTGDAFEVQVHQHCLTVDAGKRNTQCIWQAIGFPAVNHNRRTGFRKMALQSVTKILYMQQTFRLPIPEDFQRLRHPAIKGTGSVPARRPDS